MNAGWVRAQRPAVVRPDTPELLDWRWENERERDGRLRRTLTLFLAGAECPFSCVFCDLWQHTLETPTAEGALVAQIDEGLRRAGVTLDESCVESGAGSPHDSDLRDIKLQDIAVKLYNASNFFESRAVPDVDDARIARRLASCARVTVECHPKLVGERAWRFADRLDGELEIATGFETCHPDAHRRLGKGTTVDDFDRLFAALARRQIACRAFVLLGAPFVPAAETVDWAIRSVHHARERGVGRITLIPVHGGNGMLDELGRRGAWRQPALDELEDAYDACLFDDCVVTVDLWDLERLYGDAPNFAARLARLEAINESGRARSR